MAEQTAALLGRIHSIETFGTVDGPGVRMVVFFQGCPMRCAYCHNPDTWTYDGASQMTVDQILQQYEKNKSFYRGGGITATGGEPLSQLPFLTELFRKAKERGIHTCLDTAGSVYNENRKEAFEKLFAVTDLVLLDLKHSREEEHQKLTQYSQKPVLAFAKALEEAKIPVVARHVVVPGITDGEEHLKRLAHILAGMRNLKGLEILPYHTMGKAKYESLGMEYPLKDVPDMDKEKAAKIRQNLVQMIRKIRAGEAV